MHLCVLGYDHGFGGVGKVQNHILLYISYDICCFKNYFLIFKRKTLLILKISVNGIHYEMKPDVVKF